MMSVRFRVLSSFRVVWAYIFGREHAVECDAPEAVVQLHGVVVAPESVAHLHAQIAKASKISHKFFLCSYI